MSHIPVSLKHENRGGDPHGKVQQWNLMEDTKDGSQSSLVSYSSEVFASN